MNKPVLSVIVPLYNVGIDVRKCLQTIVWQKGFPEFEVIVINDGSTDFSPDIVQDDYVSKYPNIYMYTQENAGVSAARNAGIKLARGEYISFVDPDDSIGASYELCQSETYMVQLARHENMVLKEGWLPDNVNSLIARRYDNEYFMRMIKIAHERDADIVLGNQITVDTSLESPQLRVLEYVTNRTFDNSEESKRILLKHSGLRKSANFALYRREFINNEKLIFAQGMQLDEDMLFCDMAILLANRVATAVKSSYLYNRHNGTLSTGLSDEDINLAWTRRTLVLLNEVMKKPEYRAIFLYLMYRFNCWRTNMRGSFVTKHFPYVQCMECKKDTCDGCERRQKLQKKVQRSIQKLLPGWDFQR